MFSGAAPVAHGAGDLLIVKVSHARDLIGADEWSGVCDAHRSGGGPRLLLALDPARWQGSPTPL